MNGMKIGIIVGLVMMSPLANADWVFAAFDEKRTVMNFVEKTSIKGPKTKRTFWQWTIREKNDSNDKEFRQVNCDTGQISTLETNVYEGEKFVTSYKLPDPYFVIPGSVDAIIVEKVCLNKFPHNTGGAKDLDIAKVQSFLRAEQSAQAK